MIDLMNILDSVGDGFCRFALAMLVQSGILIVLLYLIDLLIRKHVRAVFRYCIWMLVFVKLVLPPTLCLPTGLGYWCGLDVWPANNHASIDVPVEAAAAQADSSAAQYGLAHSPPIRASKLEPASVAAAVSSAPITWQAVVFLIWLAGLLVLSIVLYQRCRFVGRLLAQSDKASDRLDETLQQCCRQVGLRRDIDLRLSKNTLSPAACGLLQPVVLMPASLLQRLSGEKLRAVLIHELAHIKRGDLWVNFLQTILQIVYFYNPLLWFANAVVRGVREKAVDEFVLTRLGDEADSYSSTLIDIAELALSRLHFSLKLVGVVESKKALTSRIDHILNRPSPKSTRLGPKGFAAIIMIAAILLPMAKGLTSHGITVHGEDASRADDAGGSETRSNHPDFTATLPNGVTVELVGICEHPSKGKQWWAPDGQRLKYTMNTLDKSTYPSDDPGYELVLRKSGKGSFAIKSIRGSTVRSGLQVIEPAGLTGWRAHVKASYKETRIEISSPSGNWRTVVTSNGKGSVSGNVKGKTIIFAGAERAGKDVIISCSDLVGYEYATRIIAVDFKGKELTGQTRTDTGVNGLRQRTIRFGELDLSDVAEFRFQTCPYEYCSFKNVSLKPNVEKDEQKP